MGWRSPGLGSSVVTSLEVSFGAVVATLLLLVPTIIFVHLRIPRMRTVLEAVSLLPLGIPAIVIVVGYPRRVHQRPDLVRQFTDDPGPFVRDPGLAVLLQGDRCRCALHRPAYTRRGGAVDGRPMA